MNNYFLAWPDGRFADAAGGFETRCAIGKGGMISANDKREGDGASPIGMWPMRRVFYRPDRLTPPETGLATIPLRPRDGWCDAPDDPLYNRSVTLPYPASHERLWRDDTVYDVIVELGHNDAPPVMGLGSAIFLHLAHPDYRPTEGCIALSKADMRHVLRQSQSGTLLHIMA